MRTATKRGAVTAAPLHRSLRLVCAAASLLLLASSIAVAQSPARRPTGRVLRIEELTSAALGRVERDRSVVLLVGGILEEHGPYMPNGSDLIRNVALADTLARRIAALPTPDGRPWTVLRFPLIPLGARSFDESVGQPGRPPGSFPVRAATERAVFMDLADQLGAQGFRRVLVVHGHGEPYHNRVLDQAGDYFRDTFGIGPERRGAFMVHLLGRLGCQPDLDVAPPPDSLFSPAARAENVDSPHADATELSRVLYLRPDLVDKRYRSAPNIVAATPDEWRKAARRPDWPGYVGAPRHATAALGAWNWRREISGCVSLATQLLAGVDEKMLPRYADRMLAIPGVRSVVDASGQLEEARAGRQVRWLRDHEAQPADTVRYASARIDLTGAWATGSTSEPTAERVVLSVQCNYSPPSWIIQQSGDTVRAWVMPARYAQGIPSTQITSTVPAMGRISGVDLRIGTAGARYVLRYDSTSGHLRGTLNGAPFWAVRQEVVRPNDCIPVP